VGGYYNDQDGIDFKIVRIQVEEGDATGCGPGTIVIDKTPICASLAPAKIKPDCYVLRHVQTPVGPELYPAMVLGVDYCRGICCIVYGDGQEEDGVMIDDVSLRHQQQLGLLGPGGMVFRLHANALFPATVAFINEEHGVCQLHYEDGNTEDGVSLSEIRLPEDVQQSTEEEEKRLKKKKKKKEKKEKKGKKDKKDRHNRGSADTGTGREEANGSFRSGAIQIKMSAEEEANMAAIAALQAEEADHMQLIQQLQDEDQQQLRELADSINSIANSKEDPSTLSTIYNPSQFETKFWKDSKTLPLQVAVAKVETQGSSVHFVIRFTSSNDLNLLDAKAVELAGQDVTGALKRHAAFVVLQKLLQPEDVEKLTALSCKFPKMPLVNNNSTRERLRDQLHIWLHELHHIAVVGQISPVGSSALAQFLHDPADLMKSKDEDLKAKKEFDAARKKVDEFAKVYRLHSLYIDYIVYI
jgi:hypothetical protein